MKKAYRHGEIAFVEIDKFPDNMKVSESKEFLRGSHGNPHKYDNGEFYPKVEDDFVFGYFKAKNTTLFHVEHGKGTNKLKKAKLKNGVYQLRRQNEIVNDELKKVID